MQVALSLRHQLLVEANDADYESYLNLALVCPLCHKPVYLTRARTVKPVKDPRTGKVKRQGYETRPYFAHFAAQGDAGDCENRVTISGRKVEEIIEVSKREVRLQRQQKLEEHLYEIIRMTPAMHDYSLALEMAYVSRQSNSDREFENSYRQEIASFRSVKKNVVKQLLEDNLDNLSTYLNSDDFKYLSYLGDKLEYRLHREICHDIVGFLLAPVNHKMFFPLYVVWQYYAFVSYLYLNLVASFPVDEKIKNKLNHQFPQDIGRYGLQGSLKYYSIDQLVEFQLKGLKNKPSTELSNFIAQYLASAIALTPWSYGFMLQNIKDISNNFKIKQKMTGYRLIPENQAVNSQDAFHLIIPKRGVVEGSLGKFSLNEWLNDKLRKFMGNISKVKIDIWNFTTDLPDPYKGYSLFLSMPSLSSLFNGEDTICFELTKASLPLCRASLWFSNKSHKYRAPIKKFSPQKLPKNYFSPWKNGPLLHTYLTSVGSEKDREILLQLVDAYCSGLRFYCHKGLTF